MKQTITNAAEITVLRTIDNNTLKTGGGPISVGATVVMAGRGAPFTVTSVIDRTVEKYLGTPLPKKAEGAEGLRHLNDALKELQSCNVVRVVSTDPETGAKFPSLTYGQLSLNGYEISHVTPFVEGNPIASPLLPLPAIEGTPTRAASVKLRCAVVIGDAPYYSLSLDGGVTWALAGLDGDNNNITLVLDESLALTGEILIPLGDTGLSARFAHRDQAGVIFPPESGYPPDVPFPLEGDPYPYGMASGWTWSFAISELTVALPTAAAHLYGTALSLGSGNFLQVWPIDGDPSINRSLEVTNVVRDKGNYDTSLVYRVNDVVKVTGGRLVCTAPHTATDADPTLSAPTERWKVYNGQYDDRFTLTFYDKLSDGTEYLLEGPYTVGIKPDDTDDMGQTAFIEAVFQTQSERFRVNFNEDYSFNEVRSALATAGKAAFQNGTNGGTPTLSDYKRAWDLFRNETYAAFHMFAAGNYDVTVIANMLDIADKRRVAAYFDVPPSLTFLQAIAWLNGSGLASQNARVTYSPFSANDPTYGGSMIWGASGEKVAAKCRGEAMFSGSTPGVHFAAAGINRGMLTRTGVKHLHPEDALDRDALYDARINPVIAGSSGGAVIDDDLSLWFKDNYSRFAWVVDIDNYIAHRFVQGAAALKFEPDGITRKGLNDMLKDILGELVTSGALVKPRHPEDGTKEYIITITQIEIDLWSVVWDFCPTGSARRIAGQPRLIR